MKKLFLILCPIFVLNSCAILPKATVDLSVMLEQQLNALEVSHTQVITDFFTLKREQATYFVNNEWYPLFLNDFFKEDDVVEHWNKIIGATDNKKKINDVMELTNVIQQHYMQMIDSVITPLYKAEKKLLTEIQNDFQLAKTMNNAITMNIKSVNDLQEKRKEIWSQIDKNNIVQTKLDQATEKADSILNLLKKGVDEYKNNEGQIDNILNKLKK